MFIAYHVRDEHKCKFEFDDVRIIAATRLAEFTMDDEIIHDFIYYKSFYKVPLLRIVSIVLFVT